MIDKFLTLDEVKPSECSVSLVQQSIPDIMPRARIWWYSRKYIITYGPCPEITLSR